MISTSLNSISTNTFFCLFFHTKLFSQFLYSQIENEIKNDEEEDDPLVEDWTFSPEKGNVIFASAIDCWGFGILKFANIWSKKLGLNKNVLRKHFFEDFSYNPKTKKLIKCNSDTVLEPLFATMILDPIWKLYECAVTNGNPEKAAKMAERGVSTFVRTCENKLAVAILYACLFVCLLYEFACIRP